MTAADGSRSNASSEFGGQTLHGSSAGGGSDAQQATPAAAASASGSSASGSAAGSSGSSGSPSGASSPAAEPAPHGGHWSSTSAADGATSVVPVIAATVPTVPTGPAGSADATTTLPAATDPGQAGAPAAVGAPPVAAPRPPSAARPARPKKSTRGPRRARLQLRSVSVWSALRFSVVLSIALFCVWMVMVGVLYGILDGVGAIDTVNEAILRIDPESTAETVTPGMVFGGGVVIGAVYMVLFIALSTVGTLIYNLCADLVGGVELTLSERE